MVGLELMSMLVLTSLSCGVTWPHLEGHLTASLPALPEAPDALTSTCGALQPPNLCYSHTLTPSVSKFPFSLSSLHISPFHPPPIPPPDLPSPSPHSSLT